MIQVQAHPHRIGRYVIDREIGRGGMGIVYLARDTEMDRTVALKVVATGWTRTPEHFARLMAEARALARIDHPNIPRVYGAGQDGPYCFVSREYVQGSSLLDILGERGPLRVTEALRVVRDVAHALSAVHDRRLLHRDIKTENLMLDESGRVCIVDFGIAKDLRSKVRVTRDDCYVGTLEYCSPEQLLGEDLDPRTDLYSLGVVLYELLTLALPYRGSTAAQIYSRMMRRRYRRIRKLRPCVPRSVERLVGELLRVDRKRRTRDALAVLRASHRILRKLCPNRRGF
jgi:serine/threonine-protein kinase